jgi:hypothetical protein
MQGAADAGLGLDVPLQDDKIRKFTLTPQEKADLIAFLLALTDESALPQVPKRVPSGLPVVQPQVPRLPTRLNLNSPELRRIRQMQRRAEREVSSTPSVRFPLHAGVTVSARLTARALRTAPDARFPSRSGGNLQEGGKNLPLLAS